jgi:hypothetical protein
MFETFDYVEVWRSGFLSIIGASRAVAQADCQLVCPGLLQYSLPTFLPYSSPSYTIMSSVPRSCRYIRWRVGDEFRKKRWVSDYGGAAKGQGEYV